MEPKLKILHFESYDTSESVESAISKEHKYCEFKKTFSTQDFITALKTDVFDVILFDSTLNGSDVKSAFRLSKEITPHSAFIFVTLSNILDSEEKEKESVNYDMIPHADLSSLSNTIDRLIKEVMMRQDISCHWG